MPKFAPLVIPSPFEAIERTNRLRDVSMMRERDMRDDARREQGYAADQRSRQEDDAMAQVLSRFKPEEFDTAEEFDAVIYPELNKINPMKALKLREIHVRAFPGPQDPGPLIRNKAGLMVERRQMVGQEPWAEEPPPANLEAQFHDPTTTPERRAAILKGRSEWATAGREPDAGPSSITAAIVAADTRGDAAEVQRLLNLQGRFAAAGRVPREENDDPYYARDWQRYQGYLTQHNREQTQRVRGVAQEDQPPYQRPIAFETWRARHVRRGQTLGTFALSPFDQEIIARSPAGLSQRMAPLPPPSPQTFEAPVVPPPAAPAPPMAPARAVGPAPPPLAGTPAAPTQVGLEAEARRLLSELRAIEASGGDTTQVKSRLAALRAQAGR